jgi:hypothetical protein
MKFKLFCAALVALPLFSACTKDEPVDGSSAADITFRADSGYTFVSDTVGLSDTLRIVMIAAKGTDALRAFQLTRTYDALAPVTTDSVAINDNPFLFEKQVITRAVAGTEKWNFIVIEPDGDRTQRSLTFVTQ